jgi:hypothetical protein
VLWGLVALTGDMPTIRSKYVLRKKGVEKGKAHRPESFIPRQPRHESATRDILIPGLILVPLFLRLARKCCGGTKRDVDSSAYIVLNALKLRPPLYEAADA